MRRLLAPLASLACVLLLAAALAPLAAAQNPLPRGGVQPMAQRPPTNYAVSVTPDGGSAPQRPQNSGPYLTTFAVTNTGALDDEFQITCTGLAPVTCNSVSPSYLALGSGQSADVEAWYSVGAGGQGRVTVRAMGQTADETDTGYRIVPVSGNQEAPVVSVLDLNSGATLTRDLCVAVSLGEGAAAECGDLRLVHLLPSTRTMGKARTPTLVYNSQHARPYPVVAANVTLPSSASVPDSVTATLMIGGVQKARRKWSGNQWTSGGIRRIAIGYNALSDPTNIYDWTLEVANWYGTTPMPAAPASGQLAIVNRSNSPFGAGWWVAGVEYLNIANMLWVGGDGSTRVYQPAGSNAWVAPSVDWPDTLKYLPDSALYVRLLPHRVRVYFDQQGRHVATADRLGNRTAFGYDANGRLGSILIPPTNAQLYYIFTYMAGGSLLYVTAPPLGSTARVVWRQDLGGGWFYLRDPDGSQVFYLPDGNGRVSSRTNRRGFATTFAYDAGYRVASATTDMGAGQQAIVTGVRAAETVGMSSAVDTALAYGVLDGPRTDVGDTTLFWVDRYGAPKSIRNEAGGMTRIARGDARWPGLPTRVQYHNGRVLGAAYDTRGNLLSSTDSSAYRDVGGVGQYATTRYEWDATCDFATKIRQPEGDSTRIGYGALCNRAWQEDGRGVASRVSFSYGNAFSLLSRIQTPLATARDSFAYDARGNLSATRTQMGFVTTHYRDAVGRDTLTVSPIDSAQTLWVTAFTRYDLADRDTSTSRVGPAVGSIPTQTERVSKYYDAEGNLDSLRRWSVPDSASIGTITTRWRYDRANRATVEIAPDGKADSTFYDPAGNVVRSSTRRRQSIMMAYDAADRLVQRISPAVTYADTLTADWRMPIYPNCNTTQFCIPGDTATFTYDELGNMLTANNGDARVRRTYLPNGLIESDSLWTRTWAALSQGGNFTNHVYGLKMGYDLNGRRIYLRHPLALAARFSGSPTVAYDSTAFGYDPYTGQLARVRDVLGDEFRYVFDLEGRTDTLFYPSGGHFKHYTYDPDGRAIGIRQDRSSSGYSNDAYLWYDARDKATTVRPRGYGTCAPVMPSTYSGLGALRASSRGTTQCNNRHDDEGWVVDALGNNRSYSDHFASVTSSDPADSTDGHQGRTETYQAGTGRLVSISRSGSWTNPLGGPGGPGTADRFEQYGTESRLYDAAGNQYYSGSELYVYRRQWNPYPPPDYFTSTTLNSEYTRQYYAADQRLRLAERKCKENYGQPVTSLSEEYRYDALGRRVLRRSRGDCSVSDVVVSPQSIQRFVWDGNAILDEVQYPGGNGESAANLERDTTTIQADSRHYGRILYTHGLELDKPLAVTRVGYGSMHSGGPACGGTQYAAWDPLVMAPDWDWHGDVYGEAYYGPTPPTKPNGVTVCPNRWPAPDHYGSLNGGVLLGQLPTIYQNWFGSLVTDQREASGLQYRRNRYYDSGTGRFTQEDPIGLAGGLNLYGFATGDPVNFSDPFGLNPCLIYPQACLAAGGFLIGAGGRMLNNAMSGRRLLEGAGESGLKWAVAGLSLGASEAVPAIAQGMVNAGARTAPLVEPAGRKLAQMIGRWHTGAGGRGGRDAFMAYANGFVQEAQALGQSVSGEVQGAQVAIYRMGDAYLKVDQATRRLLSYVPQAEAGWGISEAYRNLGGR
jgi:RHS repeat-associated protein